MTGDCSVGHCRKQFANHSRCQRCCICNHVDAQERKDPCPKSEGGRHKWGLGRASVCVCSLCGMSYTEHGRKANTRRDERLREEGRAEMRGAARRHYEGAHDGEPGCWFCDDDTRQMAQETE